MSEVIWLRNRYFKLFSKKIIYGGEIGVTNIWLIVEITVAHLFNFFSFLFCSIIIVLYFESAYLIAQTIHCDKDFICSLICFCFFLFEICFAHFQ